MIALNDVQMINISAEGCFTEVTAATLGGGWAGLKAGARAAPFLAWTGIGAGAITIGVGVIGAVGAGLLAYSHCD